ncbi:MAG: hypothetical protein IKS27_05670 [Oscillospiraceae bacterium]|nr:hypothetical protein [Oscillospiraceae bacterium]MBR6430683.1 hypothetical protein [Oscillospiraceae bacterium]
MKRAFLTVGLVMLCVVLLAGCGAETETQTREPTENKPAVIPQTMPEDFRIRFSFWIDENRKNVMDTDTGEIQKDLVLDGTASGTFTPGQELLERIYDKLTACRLTGITEPVTSGNLTASDTMMAVVPNTFYEAEFQIGGETYRVTGDASAWAYRDSSTLAADFCDFMDFMGKTYRSLEAYQALPAASGGYD